MISSSKQQSYNRTFMLPKDAVLNLAYLTLDPASHWCNIKLIQASSLIQMLDIEAATATSCKQSGVKFNHLGLLKRTGPMT